MIRLAVASVLAGTNLLLGCGLQHDPERSATRAERGGGSGAEQGDSASVELSIERRGCYRECPEYRMDLYRDGRVAFRNLGRNAPGRTEWRRVAAETVARTVRQIRAAGFDTLSAAYVEGSSACGPYAPDAPLVTVGVRTPTGLRFIRHDHGCADAPPVLISFELMADRAGQIEQFLPSSSGAPR